MSIFGALTSAISGLTAQAAAFSNISDNVANSQTVGYKRVDTSFTDYLTASDTGSNQSGSVIARPDYVNSFQGTISQSDDPLAMAINGQGFFAVSQQVSSGMARRCSVRNNIIPGPATSRWIRMAISGTAPGSS